MAGATPHDRPRRRDWTIGPSCYRKPARRADSGVALRRCVVQAFCL